MGPAEETNDAGIECERVLEIAGKEDASKVQEHSERSEGNDCSRRDTTTRTSETTAGHECATDQPSEANASGTG